MRARRLATTAVVLAAFPLPATAAGAMRCPRGATYSPSVPSWQAVTGFPLGARPATNEEITAYVAAVDRASARVVTGTAGTSVQGRPITYALVSAPANLTGARLGALSGRLRAMRAAGRAAARATAQADRGPAVVWIAGGVHGNEPSGSDADIRVLYDLAARTDCAARARLRALVTVLLPVQNPDGRAAGTRTNAAGFDLNRDWFAATQPETPPKLALMRRFPPVLMADQHEQGGTSFFFPPNVDPIHHEISRQALHAIGAVAAPALRRAFGARGIDHTSDATYDLFFMGYGDSAPTTLFGAGAMTFEKGELSAYPDKVAEHALAAETLLATAARHHAALVRDWAAQWRTARAQGERGALQPNTAISAGTQVLFRVPQDPVAAYALRADRHGADAAALVARLQAAGVHVRRLREAWRAPAFHAYGVPGTSAQDLPAGTFVVGLAQGPKHWVQAMLGEDAYVPFPYFYDVSAWSNPLLMGLDGGILRTPPPARLLEDVGDPAPAPPVTPPGPAGYVAPGDAQDSLALAIALLGRGVAVARVPVTGEFVIPAATDPALLAALAAAHRTPVRALASPPGAAVPLRAPRIALLATPPPGPVAPGEAQPGLSGAWARDVLVRRLGMPVDVLAGPDLAAGRLRAGGYTGLVVPDGAGAPGTLDPVALAQLQAWVAAGGTYVGERTAGVAVAQAAGVTTAHALPDPPELRIPGVSLRAELDPAQAAAWGMGSESFVFDTDDPRLAPGTAHVLARYPDDGRFFLSGYAEGTDALRGTVAATTEQSGAGHVVLFAFDAAFRGYVESTQRLLANALLIPPAGATAAATAARRAVAPSRLAVARPAGRESVVGVTPGEEAALRAAIAAAGVPPAARVVRDIADVTLRVPNPDDLSAGERGWPGRLLRGLAARGVRPRYVAF